MNANIITIVGRLAAKPQLKGYKKADGAAGFRAFMRVAVTRLGDLGKARADRRTNFIPVVCWGALAQRVGQFLDTGTEVTVVGELIAESQKQDDGTYKEYIHIQANSVQFGRRSMKNASPADVSAQMAALQARVDALAAGGGSESAPTTPAGTPADAPAPTEGGNPFETGDAASA